MSHCFSSVSFPISGKKPKRSNKKPIQQKNEDDEEGQQGNESGEESNVDARAAKPDKNKKKKNARPKSKKNKKGECTQEGFFQNEQDCHKFYRCVDQRPVVQGLTRFDFDCKWDDLFEFFAFK